MRFPDPRTWFSTDRGRHLIVDCGRVGCPRRGDVDMESCFACGHMRSFRDGTRPEVICDYTFADPLVALVRRSG